MITREAMIKRLAGIIESGDETALMSIKVFLGEDEYALLKAKAEQWLKARDFTEKHAPKLIKLGVPLAQKIRALESELAQAKAELEALQNSLGGRLVLSEDGTGWRAVPFGVKGSGSGSRKGGGARKGRTVLVDGQEYPSAAAACRALGIEYGRSSAVKVLKAKGHTVEYREG